MELSSYSVSDSLCAMHTPLIKLARLKWLIVSGSWSVGQLLLLLLLLSLVSEWRIELGLTLGRLMQLLCNTIRTQCEQKNTFFAIFISFYD